MSQPLTSGEINRLGERLRASPNADVDRDRLADYLATVQGPVRALAEDLRERLHGIPVLEATSRVKTDATIIDKLKRQPNLKLSQVQDVGGIRVVVENGRHDQDAVVEIARQAYPDCRIVDRRERPSHCYRAVHIVVKRNGLPLEIQVRTNLQHIWANTTEQLGDSWGRAIRYGGAPNVPDAIVRYGRTRASALSDHFALSSVIDSAERLEVLRDRREELAMRGELPVIVEGDAKLDELLDNHLRLIKTHAVLWREVLTSPE